MAKEQKKTSQKQKSFSLQDLATMKTLLFSEEEIQKTEMEELRKKREEKFKKDQEDRKAVQERLKKTEQLYKTRIKKAKDKVKEDGPNIGGKSIAKAAGLKSTFILDEEHLLMTAFGKGNTALPEKKILRENIQTVSVLPAFDAAALKENEAYEIVGRAGLTTRVRNPLLQPDDDQLHLRKKLEALIFGKTYEDNVHIQIAYNILDIDKILSVHVNNIIYTINNLLRNDQDSSGRPVDLFEKFSFAESWEKFKKDDKFDAFMKLIQKPQLGYFGEILWNNGQIKQERKKLWQKEFNFKDKDSEWQKFWKGKENQLTEEQKKKINTLLSQSKEKIASRAYTILCILGELRQALVHGANRPWTAVYCIDEKFDDVMAQKSQLSTLLERKESKQLRQEARKLLDKMYSDRVNKLNAGFADKAKTDMQVLLDVLKIKGQEKEIEIAQNYYEFIVKKGYKNEGFSIKKLRQKLTSLSESEKEPLNSMRYDSVRPKLNHLLDFVIFGMYKEDPVAIKAIVERLRTALSEEEKEIAYQLEAERIWAEKKTLIMEEIVPNLEGSNLKLLKTKTYRLPSGALDDVFIPASAHYFTEMIYLLTHFLDAKEINDLITTLINKFDNIASLLDVMKDPSAVLDHQFTSQFSMFDDSAALVEELKLTNSFARMTDSMPDARGAMFSEAAEILGYRMNDTEIEYYIKKMLDTGSNDLTGKKDMGFRNFIANNVVESNRFKYLVRYANPQKIRQLADNKKLIAYVLEDIPDAQILRYYNSCEMKNEPKCTDGMRIRLRELIANMNFENFEKVDQSAKTGEAARKKESQKSIIRLYLTVMYLLVKNLVYVNSRYFLAFHCIERDSLIYNPEKYKKYYVGRNKDYSVFASDFIEEHPHKPRMKEAPGRPPRISKVQTQLLQDFGNSDRQFVAEFRNIVEHLSAVMDAVKYIDGLRSVDSYYSVYHYIIQRVLSARYRYSLENNESKEEDYNPKIKEYLVNIEKYGTYSKDFTKALCVGFAYNYPRFKNLTVDGLFDKNRPKTEENDCR